MSKQRAAKLISITGNNFSEIEPPIGGWTTLYTSCVQRPKDIIGKFFIMSDGSINYLHENYQILGLKNYHPALLDLGISQLEEKCSAILKRKAESSKFPNLYHLLMKCYGLY